MRLLGCLLFIYYRGVQFFLGRRNHIITVGHWEKYNPIYINKCIRDRTYVDKHFLIQSGPSSSQRECLHPPSPSEHSLEVIRGAREGGLLLATWRLAADHIWPLGQGLGILELLIKTRFAYLSG